MFWSQSPTWNPLIVSKVQHELLAFYSVIADVDGMQDTCPILFLDK